MPTEPPTVEWLVVEPGCLPTPNTFHWTAHQQEVRKGMFLYTMDALIDFGFREDEPSWEDEQGNPIEVSFFCPVEDNPDGPPAPPPSDAYAADGRPNAPKAMIWRR